jgi:very-short-patch-repair endonuclease
MARPIDRSIARLAGRQHGYVTRAQLLELGLNVQQITYRLRKGSLIRVHVGVYAVGHLPVSGADRAAAAVLACGPGAVLSHGTAASLWGVDRRWRTPYEVTASSARRRPGILIHRGVLTRRDIRRHSGIRVTSPARTILDNAPRLTDRALIRAVNDLRLAKHLRIPDLQAAIDRCPRHPGAALLRPLVDAARGPTRSELEDAFAELSERFGLPRAQINAHVAGYEVDVLFPAQRVIVELDGYEFHGTRDAFEDDRERDATTLAAGFETVRITWERMTQEPGREAARLNLILSARS